MIKYYEIIVGIMLGVVEYVVDVIVVLLFEKGVIIIIYIEFKFEDIN